MKRRSNKKGKPMEPLSENFYKKFLPLVGRLEPERLTGDGEYSKKEVRRRFSEIMLEWKTLEKEAGRTVTEDEIWDRCIKEDIRREEERLENK